MQLDDRCRQLRSVESFWLLAGTASRTWARCCNARAVRNSESLRGLDAVSLRSVES